MKVQELDYLHRLKPESGKYAHWEYPHEWDRTASQEFLQNVQFFIVPPVHFVDCAKCIVIGVDVKRGRKALLGDDGL